jgi:hypothetical protein
MKVLVRSSNSFVDMLERRLEIGVGRVHILCSSALTRVGDEISLRGVHLISKMYIYRQA